MARFRGSRAEALIRALLLAAAAAAPFAPLLMQAIRLGVPDILLAGDGAVIELRTWQAAHGVQLLGPYSRFYWSHPGPAFFYLALPVYEAAHEHGPALNLFAVIANLIVAIAIVFTARRLRGDVFAWMTAAWLAVLELVALPFLPASIWNPVTPVLPLVLLSLLGARLALGTFGVLPAFVFIASAIVQTHIGFGPMVAMLAAAAVIALARRDHASGRRRWRAALDRRWIPVTTIGVLIVCWMLPFYEGVTAHPSNTTKLWHFFKARNPDTHAWSVVIATLRDQLAMMPIAVARALRLHMSPAGPLPIAVMALAVAGASALALIVARVRRDAVPGILAAIALGEMAVSVAAIRAIRGPLEPYLLYWMAVPGVMALAAVSAWMVRANRSWRAGFAVAAVALIAMALSAPVGRARIYGDKDVAAEQLAHEVEQYVRSQQIDDPVIRLAAGEVWPTAAAVILHLRKQRVPVFVEPAWSFMFGKVLEDPGGDHPRLVVGNRTYAERADARGLTRVTTAGDVWVYFEPPSGLEAHRIQSPPALTASVGVNRDPRLAVDGIIPPDGTFWNAGETVALRSTSSSVTVDVPHEAVNGVFVSADGNDLYAVRCGDRGVTVAPISGDGSYSIGEIGFLHP